ncbi:MAG TPA: TIGR02281 family clan AA aspartic protease [Hyphomicrobiales bacterium]|nr:TIGR02281 family clan AA aspartic protease [Hyphomicrobiales bacterium]
MFLTAWLAILVLIGAAIALVVTRDSDTIAGFAQDDFARVVYGAAILVFLAGTLSSARGRILQAFKHLTGWMAVMLVLVGLYSYRAELALVADRVVGELSPRGTQINVTRSYGSEAVRIKKGWGGHFVVKAQISNMPIEMIVDTGASTVVLSHEDAKRLGIRTRDLRYTVNVQTANGSSEAARIYLDNVAVGSVNVSGVETLVAKPGSLHQSLLGMSFLSRLRSYEFSGDFLELRG